jgi:hypothetical protein
MRKQQKAKRCLGACLRAEEQDKNDWCQHCYDRQQHAIECHGDPTIIERYVGTTVQVATVVYTENTRGMSVRGDEGYLGQLGSSPR